MERSSDAVGDRLAVAIDQRDVDRKVHLWPRHHLPLEGIAMDIDDARQHHEVACVQRERAASVFWAKLADFAAGDRERGFLEFAVDQGTPGFNEDVSHNAALRLALVAGAVEAASYLSRKSSIASLRKSGRAAWSAS